ncbi:MAG: hypothetical protein MI757_09370 [Pirellulales bacterium]|nr:hypothetical protein [Pirellulales bacterium]
MNSTVIGTIELASQPVESLAPVAESQLPDRIRKAYRENAPHAELAIVTDEIIEADVAQIRNDLRRELAEIMRAVDALGRRA